MNLSSSQNKQKALHVVSSEKAATMLLHPETIDLLRPFMRHALTVQEASKTLGLPFMKVHYQIKKLLALNLLEVVETFIFKGRERKRYRAKARRFFVPFKTTHANDLKSFLRAHDAQWYEPMLNTYVKNLQQSQMNIERFGIGLRLDENDVFLFSLTDDPHDLTKRAPYSDNMDTLWDTSFYLSHDDVEAMQTEVKAVLAKYKRKRSGARYLVRFAYAPWED